jgi:serine/threonine protein kinase
MELVRGTPLQHFRERFGELDFALPVLRQIALGLQTVHAHDIVHRDLKPANVIIAESKELQDGLKVKLVDFGVSTLARGKSRSDGEQAQKPPQLPSLPTLADEPAQSESPKSGQLTAVGMLVGTPMYLAPELAEGSRLAGPPSDIFSFGVIAYELVAKTMPFSEPPVVTRYRGEPLVIPPLQPLPAGQSAPLQTLTALIGRCLAEDPAIRPTAEEILAVLAAPQG